MTLDELLLEWSYRSEKGYPHVGSPSDVSILKEILTELKLSEEDVSSIIDELEDEPGGDNLISPGTDGMEDSGVENEKEKQVRSTPEPEPEPEPEPVPTPVARISGAPIGRRPRHLVVLPNFTEWMLQEDEEILIL